MSASTSNFPSKKRSNGWISKPADFVFQGERSIEGALAVEIVEISSHDRGTEEQLVREAQTGCLLSFERLVEYFQDRLFTFLVQIVGNEHDAQDIAQETFIKVYNHLASYDGRARFSTWLFAIAKNTAYNHLRRRKVHQPIDAFAEVLTAVSPAVDPSERESLWNVARTLKPKFFETLWLFYAEGFSLKEIAEILNTNSLTVRVNLHRARNALGKKLTQLERQELAAAWQPQPFPHK
jgi:RNA polymerase sigma-70 factor, ECF subfamily